MDQDQQSSCQDRRDYDKYFYFLLERAFSVTTSSTQMKLIRSQLNDDDFECVTD